MGDVTLPEAVVSVLDVVREDADHSESEARKRGPLGEFLSFQAGELRAYANKTEDAFRTLVAERDEAVASLDDLAPRAARCAEKLVDAEDRLAAALADRERMRKLLQQISETGCGCNPICRCGDLETIRAWRDGVQDAARAALEGK
jgi:hypothetical protein